MNQELRQQLLSQLQQLTRAEASPTPLPNPNQDELINALNEAQQFWLRLSAANLSEDWTIRSGRWTWEFATGNVLFTPQLKILLELPEDHLITPDTYRKLVHEDDRAEFDESLQLLFDEDTTLNLRHRLWTMKGRELWITLQGHLARSDTGAPLELRLFISDITETVEQEQALHQLEAWFRYTARVGEIFPWRENPQTRHFEYLDEHVWSFVNVPEALRLQPMTELFRAHIEPRVLPEDLPQFRQMMNYMDYGMPFDVTYRRAVDEKGDHVRKLRVVGTRILDPHKHAYYVGVVRDITDEALPLRPSQNLMLTEVRTRLHQIQQLAEQQGVAEIANHVTQIQKLLSQLEG
jgi:PAS domain-containing protein